MSLTLAGRPDRFHGRFSCSSVPIATVAPGASVELTGIPDVGWGLEPPTDVVSPRRKVEPRSAGPCLMGPIAVQGAIPGDTLSVRIDEIVPGDWGWTYAGAQMGDEAMRNHTGVAGAPLTLLRWKIDRAAGVVESTPFGAVPLRPFLGSIGLAPDVEDACAWTPHQGGGNLDCRELVAGTTILLPVLAEGALLSLGDGHAAQGDGEVAGTAVECSLDRVRITIDLIRGRRLIAPIIETPNAVIACGVGQTLEDAAGMAMSAIIDEIQHRRPETGLDRALTIAFASAAVHLRITQLVNPRKGVHAVWPRAGSS